MALKKKSEAEAMDVELEEKSEAESAPEPEAAPKAEPAAVPRPPIDRFLEVSIRAPVGRGVDTNSLRILRTLMDGSMRGALKEVRIVQCGPIETAVTPPKG